MNKQIIINAFRDSILNNQDICKKIFGSNSVPEQFEDVVLSLSSIDYIDLLIDVESRLGIEIAEESISATRICVGELVKRIEKYV